MDIVFFWVWWIRCKVSNQTSPSIQIRYRSIQKQKLLRTEVLSPKFHLLGKEVVLLSFRYRTFFLKFFCLCAILEIPNLYVFLNIVKNSQKIPKCNKSRFLKTFFILIKINRWANSFFPQLHDKLDYEYKLRWSF